MKLQFFKALWGHKGSWAEAAQQAAEAGFAGLEGALPTDAASRKDFQKALADYGLLHIAEVSTTGYACPMPGSTVDEHLEAFERLLDISLATSPLFVSSMAGNDLWTFSESVRFLTEAYEMVEARDAMVGFETHRSRTLFHPIITRELLKEVPPIELTLDFSHWCVVTERLVLDELPDVLALCAERVLHIQPRVGYDQGPQVPDPRAPEYANALDAHIRWWRAMWAGQKARGFETITMTPEFGPDGYLHLEPFTQKPVGDLWDINTWIAGRLKEEFNAWQAEQEPAAPTLT
jgi:Xylose isomerase-like TIM barrel